MGNGLRHLRFRVEADTLSGDLSHVRSCPTVPAVGETENGTRYGRIPGTTPEPLMRPRPPRPALRVFRQSAAGWP
jgi:hypothetical protein